jgi:hypothetical protein
MMTRMSWSDVYTLVKPEHAKGAGKMIGRWRQSILVSLTAALFLGAAGAYAISLGSLTSPSRADLPVIALSGSIDPGSVAATTPPEPAVETTAAAETATEPTVPAATAAPARTSKPAAKKDAPREVITPDVREEDPDDDEDDEIYKHDDEESSDRESSSRDEPELDD